MAEVTNKIRKRIAQLHALVGSSNENESKTALEKLLALLQKIGKSWNDIPDLLPPKPSSDAWWRDNKESEASSETKINNEIPAFELVEYILQEYVDMKPHEYIAWALWIMHTHVFDRFMVSPRLAFTSPVRGCGKTTALDLTERLSPRAQRMDGVSAAAIYRMVDSMRCTLLVDEADNLGLTTIGILRAVLNSGHRRGGKIIRVIKDQPKRFSTFGPMAIAAIGILPLTIMARSVVIHMERTEGARVLKRLEAGDNVLNVIYHRVVQWAKTAELDLDPEMPAELRNRQADNWRPLISIADSFGAYWGERAREAAIIFNRGYRDEDIAVMLLANIRTIFSNTPADRLTSEQLVASLNDMDDEGWSEWRGLRDDQQPRPLSQGQLALILRPFGIRPRSIWPRGRQPGSKSHKGYFRSQFETAWRQYCPENGTPAQQRKIRQLLG